MSKSICRLCLTTESLEDLFKMDGDTTLDNKITSCIDLKLHPEDGLPSVICKTCKRMIRKFYNFRQKCLSIQQELRNVTHNYTLIIEDHAHNHENNYEFKEKLQSDSNDIPSYSIQGDDIIISCTNELIEGTTKDNTEKKHEAYTTTQCELCGDTFDTKSEYKKHLSSHNRVKLFQCKFCPKSFTRAETNVNHMRSHMGIKPYVCETCGHSSTRRQDMIRHMKIHSDEKEHECSSCGKRFKRLSDLCSHKRTHTGVRPYKCRYCNKDYTSHSGLRKHYKLHFKGLTAN